MLLRCMVSWTPLAPQLQHLKRLMYLVSLLMHHMSKLAVAERLQPL